MADQVSGSLYIHEPLPYLVRLKVVVSDDAIPETRECRIVAYSLMEAAFSALFQNGGSEFDGVKYSIVSVEPDLIAYLKMKLKEGQTS